MGASYPRPDDERVNRTQPVFGWIDLPETGREGAPPPLPDWREWSESTMKWWAALWARPQATQWEQTGESLHVLAVLHADLAAQPTGEKSKAAAIAAEMRQIEDRHGLSPKSMLQMRWRVHDAGQPTPAATPRSTRRSANRKGAALKVLTGGAAS